MISIRLFGIKRLILIIASCALWTAARSPALASVCTLADHIRSANTNTAVGFCPAGTSHDIITITEDITLTEPLPPITGTITIEGGGHTVSGDKKFPIFIVDGGRLTINKLTLMEGYHKSAAGSNYKASGAVTLRPGSQVTVNHSTFALNFGRSRGGAINVNRSRLTVNNSSFIRNQAEGNGSAISIFGSAVVISNSSFVGNATHGGGAISVDQDSTVDISNSVFFDNYAGKGGAVATQVTDPFAVVPTRTTLTHVTMVDNRAGEGSNIWVDENDVNFKLRNSLIIGNSSGSRTEVSACRGPLRENIGNFIEDGSCASMAGGDPMLAEMTGDPAHFDLLDGSPALDAADARFCLETDQLGTPRPQGAGCDIGAIESTTALPAPSPVVPPPPCPLDLQITAANTDAPAGGCPAGSGHDVITLTADIDLDAPLPPITSEITIEGNGYTISASERFRIFAVNGGALTISNLTLTAGKASTGGAILLKTGGRATVTDVTFRDNSAFLGGAIATESEGDRLTVRDSSFIGNTAETSGGAIAIDGGSVDIGGSAFFDNRAEARGGAIATLQGRAAVSNSTVSGNAAVRGGGIYAIDGETTLTHLTVVNNHAEHIVGAGIYAEGGAVLLRNSIVAGSGSGDDCSGRFAQSLGNFSEDGRCAEQEGGDPILAALTGSPAYHSLQDSSPAHGSADPAFCLPADQLGNPRTHCDIGAIESARDPNYLAAPAAGLPDDCTLADQIIAANTDQPAGACPAGDGADVIRLRQDITLNAPLPSINSDIAIDGKGHTISGDNRFHIFNIESGNVVFKRITLRNGLNTSDEPEGYGGAITLRNSADLMVYDATFRNNRARRGGAVASIDASHLYIFESRFLDNEASSKGGALWRDGACGFISDIIFRRNIAGELAGTANDDYFTHMDGGARTCSSDPETYTLSDN